MKSVLMKWFTMLLCVLCGGCVTWLPGDPDIRKGFNQYLELSFEEQDATFRTLSIEDQYLYYLRAVIRVHPPLTWHSNFFAENGEAGIDFLKERLDEDPSDEVTIHILLALGDIVCINRCCQAHREEVAEIIEREVEAMRWKGDRTFALRMLSHRGCLHEFIDFSEVRTVD